MRKLIFIVLAFFAFFTVSACTPAATSTIPNSNATTSPFSTTGAASLETLTDLTTAAPDYDDFDTLANYDEVFTLSDITYLVYLYSPECHNCVAIKAEMLAFASAYGDYKIFFFDVSGTVFGDRDAFLDAVDKTTLLVPYLVLVQDNSYFGSYLGTTEIRAAIAAIAAGTLTNWE